MKMDKIKSPDRKNFRAIQDLWDDLKKDKEEAENILNFLVTKTPLTNPKIDEIASRRDCLNIFLELLEIWEHE